MADETQKTLIDITALKYFYKSLQNVTVLIAPSSIEAASASNLGRTYFIPVDGTYAGINCSKGDHIVSNGVAWILIPKGTSEGGKEYFAGTGIDISTVDGKDVISNTGVRKIAKADENHPGTIKATTGNNNPEYIEVAGLDTAAFMPYEVELTEDSDDAIPTSKAVADYVADEIADLSVADSEVEGQYVSSVAQEDGKITINRQSLPTPKDTYDATSSEAISGKGVADAIKAKQDSLSADQMSAVNSGITADLKANYDTAYAYSQETHARVDATKVEASETNGKIKINDVDTTVYTHPGTGTNPHGTTKADVGLSKVGNFKAVSTVASQGLTDTEKANAKANLGISDASSRGVDTSITASASNNNVPTSKAVKDYVDTEIENLPEPMIFKGSLGTNGTITSLPTAAKANMGFTYKVITAGTYASQSAKVGDTFISTGTEWELIPSGDEPSGTVTSVGVSVPTGLSVSGTPVTTSGTIAISMASGYSIPTTAKQEAWDGKSVVAKSDTNGSIKINGTDTVVYTHPTGTNPHGTTKSDVGLGNVGNFKAVSTVASQGLTNTEKSNARTNIGAGTYSKASTGIPKTDLASAVQTSLGLADTALQEHQSLADYVKTTDSRLTDARASNDVQAYAKTGSGITVAKSVPSNAKFTDTTYSAATTSANGLMSSTDKTKLDGIATGATAVSESTVSGWGFTKNTGTVTKVSVGGLEFSPSSGVVSLPAYPTSLPASNTTNSYSATGTVPVSGKAVASALSSYVKTDDSRLTNAREPAFGNNKWYSVGDDVKIGDHNVSGGLGIMGANGNTRLDFCKRDDATVYKSIIFDGTNLSIDGKVLASASTKGTDTTMPTTPTDERLPTTKLMKAQLDTKVQKTSVSSGENSTTSVINVTDAKAQMAMVAKISGKTIRANIFSGYTSMGSYTNASEKYNGHDCITSTGAWGGAYDGNMVLKSGKTYVISAMIKTSVANTVYSIGEGEAGTLLGSMTIASANTWTRMTVKVNATRDITKVRIGSQTAVTSTISEFMVSEYDQLIPYCPPSSLASAPVKSVVSFPKNLFTASLITTPGCFRASNGTHEAISGGAVCGYIEIPSGATKVTLSGGKAWSSVYGECFFDKDKKFISTLSVKTTSVVTKDVPSNAKYIGVSILPNGASDERNTLQIEVGSSATAHTDGGVKTTVLVLQSIIDKCPDYGIEGNILDFENGVYYHNYTKKKIKDLTWGYQASSSVLAAYVTTGKSKGNNYNIIIPEYTGTSITDASSMPNKSIRFGSAGDALYVKDSSYTSGGAFTADKGELEFVYELVDSEKKTIPLTDYIRPLPVEAGGTITLVNEHNLDMPSVIKYKKEVN